MCSVASQDYLKKVTTEFPDDVEAWIELAGIVEQIDTGVSLVLLQVVGLPPFSWVSISSGCLLQFSM